ncbi:uncharacterized protein KGF55_003484 [Candida pseudojiufengensis]|uniref:uncharacterized protein n=1 Tax=Candida pseudojiufengensis TaxID=497109 RepID=UPI0022258EFA|nr:uncharacterized protein KGF55_003484 [Candida pseudojiufengensis]KAI5962408.1 hypothetical protein KGF55_003484 [Candida pseudojiufengensis]
MSLSKVPKQIGTVHTFGFNLTAFEFDNNKVKDGNSDKIVLFIGGLSNGLLNIPYLPILAQALESEEWSLAQLLLSSAYTGYGITGLANDTEQIDQAVKYFKSPEGGHRKKIVLMGHSTGCQNVLHHSLHGKEKVNGIILQAPVSDQEAIINKVDPKEYENLIKEVQDEYISKDKSNELLPEKFRKINWGIPITAYRFNSLYNKRGDDDFFSSYLKDEEFNNTFGKVQIPILVLYSGNDQFVPKSIDKNELLSKFKKATQSQFWNKNSKIIEGGSHNLGDDSRRKDVINELIDSVLGFIESAI